MNGPVHNLLMLLFALDNSKIEVLELFFLNIPSTQNDHPTYVEHVLGRFYVFFTLFGVWVQGRGEGLPRDWYTTRFCSFSSWAAQKQKFLKSPRKAC